jgi:hypothetical protein
MALLGEERAVRQMPDHGSRGVRREQRAVCRPRLAAAEKQSDDPATQLAHLRHYLLLFGLA